MDELSHTIRKYYRNKALPDDKIAMILAEQRRMHRRDAPKVGYWVLGAAIVILAAGIGMWYTSFPFGSVSRVPTRWVMPKTVEFESEVEPIPRFDLASKQPLLAVMKAAPDSIPQRIEENEKLSAAERADTHPESSRNATAPSSDRGSLSEPPSSPSGLGLRKGYGFMRENR